MYVGEGRLYENLYILLSILLLTLNCSKSFPNSLDNQCTSTVKLILFKKHTCMHPPTNNSLQIPTQDPNYYILSGFSSHRNFWESAIVMYVLIFTLSSLVCLSTICWTLRFASFWEVTEIMCSSAAAVISARSSKSARLSA